jgi:hypothetical protein
MQVIQVHAGIRQLMTAGDTIVVSIGSISGNWNARLFGTFICLLPLALIFGGFAMCRWAIRNE